MSSAPRVMWVVDPREPGVLDALARLRGEVKGDRLAVQLRMKDATDAERIAASRTLAGVLPIDAALIVNGSAAVARAIAADGVHLPEAGGSVAEARAIASGAIVGCSCHDERGARARDEEGADYLVLGPLGDVPGKPAMRDDDFASIARGVRAPVLALGGVAREEDVRRASSLGARGVALQRALLLPSAAALVRAALEVFAR